MAQKQHSRPRERVGEGQEAASLLLTLSVPLAGPRHPSGHFLTSPEGRKGEGGRALEQRASSEQGSHYQHRDLFWGREGREHHDRMKCERLVGNTTGLPIGSLPGSPGPSAAGPRSPSQARAPGPLCLCFSSPASASWHLPPGEKEKTIPDAACLPHLTANQS